MKKNKNLKSSIEKEGEIVDKYILFSNGNEKTIRGVITSTIEQSQFTKFKTTDGKLCCVNTKNVDYFEVFK